FMESYLKLTAEETIVYNKELAIIEPKEREVVMHLTNEWVEQGIERGIVQGRSQGRIEGDLAGRRALVLRLLHRPLGKLAPEITGQIGRLGSSQIGALGEAVLYLHNLTEILK